MAKPGPRNKILPTETLLTKIETGASYGATWKELCARLDISEKTLSRLKFSFPEVKSAYEKGKSEYQDTLRRLQFNKAKREGFGMENGSSMLRWLGIQELGQRNKTDLNAMTMSFTEALMAMEKMDQEAQKALPATKIASMEDLLD